MSRPLSLKQKLAAGQTTIVFAIGRLAHHNLVQMYGMTGAYDGFWIDDEHAGFTAAQIEVMSLAGRAHGMDSFVRLPPTDYASVTRALESGVGGVMAAQVHSAEQAREFSRWACFPPVGERGLNNAGYDGRFGSRSITDFVAGARENTFIAIQIETLGSLEECAEIAAIESVDHLFVGPMDLSVALGVPGDLLHPKCRDAINRVAAACREAGKSWGAVTPTPEHARFCRDQGCQLISLTNDVRLVNAGLAATRERFSEFFPE